MKRRVASGIMLSFLLIGMSMFVFNIQPVEGWTGTVYIRADGSIEPSDAPITTYDNITYTLTDSISSNGDGMVVERSNITINGNGYTLQGASGFDNSGIYLSGRENVTVKNTQIKGFYYGILLVSSDHNRISRNTMVDNGSGIYLYGSSNNSIFRNNLTMVLWAGFGNGTILHVWSRNNTVARNTVTNLNVGLAFYWHAYNNSIIENNITNNCVGILSYNSNDYNNIVGNNITDNEYGVSLSWSSNYNTIIGNKITANNQNGIELICASNNIIHHNNFTDNTQQVYDHAWDSPSVPPSINVWDDGYPSGGNYWSDYTGVDLYSGPSQDDIGSDGIGDTPHVIDENNQDNYPLMELGPVPPTINASVDIFPCAINLRAKPKYVNTFIELPEGYSVSEIDTYSILMNGTISIDPDTRTVIGDYDSNGIADLKVKFNGTEVIEYILASIKMTKPIEERFMTVTLTITGYLNDGPLFKGNDTMKIILSS